MSDSPVPSSFKAFVKEHLQPKLPATALVAFAVALAVFAIKLIASWSDVQVAIEMRSNGSRDLELFYAAPGEGFSQGRSVAFHLRTRGQWHEYVIAVPEERDIARMRFDPCVGSAEIEIRRIEVIAERPSVLTAPKLAAAMLGTSQMELVAADDDSVLKYVAEGHDPHMEFDLPANVGGPDRMLSAGRAAKAACITGLVVFAFSALGFALLGWLSKHAKAHTMARAAVGGVYLRTAWAFAGTFLILGLCIAFTEPAFSVPDEAAHWLAGHMRSERLLGDRDCVNLLPFGDGNRHTKHLIDYDQLDDMPLRCVDGYEIYGDALTYPGVLLSKIIVPNQQVSAIRQLQGVLVSRLVQGALFALMLVRLLSLAGRWSRAGVLAVLALAVSPLFAQQAFGVSADGAQFCFAVSLFTTLVYWDRLSWWDAAWFALFGWASAGKPLMLPCIVPSVLAGFWYAQARAQQSGLSENLRALISTFGALRPPKPQTVVLWAAVGISVQILAYAALENKKGRINLGGADAGAQLQGILGDPLVFGRVFLNYVSQTLGRGYNYTAPLGWLDTPLSGPTAKAFFRLCWIGIAAELVAVPFWVLHQPRQVSRQLVRRLSSLLLPTTLGLLGTLGGIVIVVMVMYLAMTPVGADFVQGVQVRYFFPPIIVGLGVVFGAINVAFGAESHSAEVFENELEPEAPLGAFKKWALRVVPPTIIILMSFRYVARVFIDLAQRYL